MVRWLLRRARDRGLTAPGGPLHGLPDTFAVYESEARSGRSVTQMTRSAAASRTR